MTPDTNQQLAKQLGTLLVRRNIHCAVAESCTGGLVGALITAIPGSSQWFDRGFITYSNAAKEQMLGVTTLNEHGAVSEATARAMAEGAITHSDAEVSIAITGIAGPDGGSNEKPVGTVWIAWALAHKPTQSHCYFFTGNRATIREQAARMALQGLIARL